MDAAAIAYQRVWESFQRSESTHDGRHDTAHWRAHTGPYAACIVRVPADSIQPHLTALRRQLAQLSGVRLHPDHFLHIMLQELGFVVDPPRQSDEISAARLEEFAQAATGPISVIAPITIALGGASSFQDAVFLELDVGSAGRLSRLHERLFDLAAISRIPSYPFLPHCTLAHYDGTTPHADASAVLAMWRSKRFGKFPFTEAEIVTLDPSEPYPELTTYAVIPLGE